MRSPCLEQSPRRRSCLGDKRILARSLIVWCLISLTVSFSNHAADQTPVNGPTAIGKNTGQAAELEGAATYVKHTSNTLELALKSGASRIRVKIADASGLSSSLLLNSRLRCKGTSQTIRTLEGDEVAGVLLVPGKEDIKLLELPQKLWVNHPVTAIGTLLETNRQVGVETIVHVAGRVTSSKPSGSLTVEDATGSVSVEALQPDSKTVGTTIEVLARRNQRATGVVLDCAYCRDLMVKAITAVPSDLTFAADIKRMKCEEALHGYQVCLRGVITCIDRIYNGVVIQDSTMGIYVGNWPCEYYSKPAEIGDYWEVEGLTDAGFAPMINCRRAIRLGEGILPEPIDPTMDQLMTGSLDTQYVEIQGIITEVHKSGVTLLTRGGKIRVELFDLDLLALRADEHALARLRGCLFVVHKDQSEDRRQDRIGEIQLHGASWVVDEPPPADLFIAPMKQAGDLRLFDPQAGAFQRIKVAGQIIYEQQGECYLVDGTNGLGFRLKKAEGLQVSDLVEVAGFPDLSGASPMLQEAVARKTGRKAMPEATRLVEEDLIQREHDSTLVCVDGLLAGVSKQQADSVIEMQVGVRTFVARLTDANRFALSAPPVGSRLELTGVYKGLGGNQAEGREIDSFELLLNSPSDIQILARPPWWTLERLMTILGILATVLLLALIWIRLLSRQVTQRASQLKQEIQERERAEHQQALEEERSRIARDLHDDLGSSLTEISMLAESGRDCQSTEDPRQRFGRILTKARTLVRALDEIVWAVDPRQDTVSALVRYLASFAEEYLLAVDMPYRVQIPPSIPDCPLAAHVRHHLFLGVKESLNNAARHSQAQKVWFQIEITNKELSITLSDNGRGFDSTNPTEGNGLTNLRRRLAGLNGQCKIDSQPGTGTTVLLTVALNPNPSAP